ncbi:MAG: cytidylate kinase [SAR86 cluster bacterium]|uniref:Cytidylate kinase n=1 Tax=SAR86 cluster bacterium TaxID=2030880 RepID=A0A2A5BAK5_9GAMM|nr:MAG: cytidylate kinase [SAR86 cluster bacterium]
MSNARVIAIDGPSGSGKGTIASLVADNLGYKLLDSGALYRVLGVAVLKYNIDINKPSAVAELAGKLNIEFGRGGPGTLWLDGESVTKEIRTAIASDMASTLGAMPAAREALLEAQLGFRQPPGLVADGRDMGTVVFPDARPKIYLTASPEERAERRYKQLIGKGIDAILPDLLRDLKERDQRDSERTISPLKPAKDAVIIDTTNLDIDQVVSQVLELVAGS